jgi:RHS repeat-associated protein
VTVTGNTNGIKLCATSFTGVHQTAPLDTYDTVRGTDGNPSASLTTLSANDVVISTLHRHTTNDATTSQTALFKDRQSGTLGASSYQLATSAGTYTDTYTGAVSGQFWAMIIAGFKPAVSTATDTIAFIATSTNPVTTGLSAATTTTWQHTTSGSNRLLVLVADLWQNVAGLGKVSAASYNGTALTRVASTSSGAMTSEIWYLANPTSGANQMSVTIDDATVARKLAASSFTGVHQTSSVNTSSTNVGFGGNPSNSLTTTAANALVLATLSRFSNADADTNRTSLYNDSVTSTLGAASYQIATDNDVYSDTYTLQAAGSADWTMTMAAFQPGTTSYGSTATTTTTLAYDNNGNLTAQGTANGTTTYTWDYHNRLLTIASSTTSTFNYDHTGDRARFYDGTRNRHIANKYYNVAGLDNIRHIFVNGMMVATVAQNSGNSTTTYVHTDHLTGSNVITDTNGAIAETLDYYPYGVARIDAKVGGYAGEQRKFIGQEYDAQTALSYLNARYYDGTRGQFISQDPVFWEVGITRDGKKVLINPQAQNSYSYAGNNPITQKDPDGRDFIDAGGSITAPVYGVVSVGPTGGVLIDTSNGDLYAYAGGTVSVLGNPGFSGSVAYSDGSPSEGGSVSLSGFPILDRGGAQVSLSKDSNGKIVTTVSPAAGSKGYSTSATYTVKVSIPTSVVPPLQNATTPATSFAPSYTQSYGKLVVPSKSQPSNPFSLNTGTSGNNSSGGGKSSSSLSAASGYLSLASAAINRGDYAAASSYLIQASNSLSR